MCGIAGLLLREPRLAAEPLHDIVYGMAETLRHRGPDGDGVWVDPAAGVALGHRRLSIQDLSDAGAQPMHADDGRLVLTYNGEVYNFPALRDELEDAGHKFRGHSDTEVLLAALAEWGLPGALERLVGMYAFAVWDRRERALWLVRDRAGQKPLYYGWCDDSLLFASELKALRAHPDFRAGVDPDALGQLLQYGWVPGPRSILGGIHKLPAGCALRLTAETRDPQPLPYWSPRDVAERGAAQPFRGDLEEATEALAALLGDAVRGRMISDVRLGALLSGGIDSSTVVALMQRQSEQPVKTFSIGFHEPRYDEAHHAKAVASHLGTEHRELYVSERETRELIPRLPRVYDEPFADASQIPTLAVAELARGEVTVALSGDGGDELFCGYNRYYRCEAEWRLWHRVPRPARHLLAGALDAAARGGWSALRPRGVVEERLPAWRRAPAKATKLVRALPARDAGDWFRRMQSRCTPVGALVPGARALPFPGADTPERGVESLQRMMLDDFAGYLGDDILVKVDRASMAVNLEVRSPFLDHRVVEFAWSLPLAFRASPDGGKRVVRELLARHVPRALFERRKQGFAVPVAEWLRGALRPWAEDLLAPERLRRQGLFDPDAVHRVWQQHQCGWRNHHNLLWSILMFQAWEDAWATRR